ncbi:unnamed protein product, partial [Owenia fusiformis]
NTNMLSGPEDYCNLDVKSFDNHKDEVNSVAFSNDFEMMVTACDDCRVRVFNSRSGDMVVKLKAHTGAVRCIAVSPNSRYIVSGSYDNTAIIWQTRDASLLHMLKGHTKSVEAVAFSSDSLQVCTASWDRSAILWDIQNGHSIKIFTGHSNVIQGLALSYDSKWLATGSWDHTVRLWTLNSADRIEKVHCLEGHTGNVNAVAFSKMGMLASGSYDKSIRLWNPRNLKVLHLLTGHEGWIKAVSFSTDSSYVASASDDETVKVWCCLKGVLLKTLESRSEVIHQCGFTPGGALVASGAANVTLALVDTKFLETSAENDGTSEIYENEDETL